jgi:hypothetical protein
MKSDYKAGSKSSVGRNSQLTAIRRVVWGSALGLSGREGGCLVIPVTRELLERIACGHWLRALGLRALTAGMGIGCGHWLRALVSIRGEHLW